MKKLFLLLIIIITPIITIAQSAISFQEESIDFDLNNNFFTINGLYTFRNDSKIDIEDHILFPFAVASDMVDTISVFNLKTKKNISYQRQKNSISFDLFILSQGTIEINIYYRQPSFNLNRYILTSTQCWGKPLDRAFYALSIDKQIKIESFSYDPDSNKTINDKIIYYWSNHNFYPKNDFDININK